MLKGKKLKTNKQESEKKEKGVFKETLPKEIPYPLNPSKVDKQWQYAHFVDTLSRLQLNLPFLEALEQFSSYAKFMKEFDAILPRKGIG